MSTPLFVITGCKGSGLARSARVFTALGAPCGHEGVFHPEAFQAGRALFWPSQTAGEASWFAAPVLGKLPPGCIVLHQTRHPLATIAELHLNGFFDRGGEPPRFAEDFVPETGTGDPLSRAMHLWLRWNEMIEAGGDDERFLYRRVRGEELDAKGFVENAALFGVARSRAACEMILDEVDVPAAPAPGLSWEELPAGNLRDDVASAAERYGYAA